MSRMHDLTGTRAGMLVAERFSRVDDYGRAIWFCRCDCGNAVERKAAILVDAAKRGKKSHCGCSHPLKTHGMTKSHKKLHWVWAAMIQRCENENSKDYKDYGGRGITVCKEWRNNFGSFVKWAESTGYREGLSIDRIDTGKGYTPKNCEWASIKQQMRNQRKTVMVEWSGETRPLTEWAEIAGLSEKTLRQRIIKLKWPIDRAMTTIAVKGRNQHSAQN